MLMMEPPPAVHAPHGLAEHGCEVQKRLAIAMLRRAAHVGERPLKTPKLENPLQQSQDEKAGDDFQEQTIPPEDLDGVQRAGLQPGDDEQDDREQDHR